jgi:ubiquinone/menaquinone biosynthesis C-methylase UbiE
MSTSLKHTFDEVALLYHEARPRYPFELLSTLVEIVGLNPGSRLLEIGPGTGQATMPLAQKGFNITAIELGESLAEVARHELRDYKNVEIISGAFEETILPKQSFDLVYAATSFHWIDASMRYSKTHTILKDKGHLSIIHTNHVSDENGDTFFNASQPIFDRYGFTDKRQKPNLPKNRELKPENVDTNFFKVIHFQLFPIVITYTAKNFVKLLNTFSNHLAAEKKIQHAFYREIESLINEYFEGTIDKYFTMSLTIAEKC